MNANQSELLMKFRRTSNLCNTLEVRSLRNLKEDVESKVIARFIGEFRFEEARATKGDKPSITSVKKILTLKTSSRKRS